MSIHQQKKQQSICQTKDQKQPQQTSNFYQQQFCCEKLSNKGSVTVQSMPQEQKVKLQTGTLGVQPYEIDQEDEEANFISCRLGDIISDEIKSTQLKSLLLRNNLISKIQGFQHLPHLVQLQLYDNKITCIEGLQQLKQLQILDLSYNNIKKIEGVSHLKKLKKLFLLSNKIKKIENLDLPQLQMLELGSNKIKEIQNLEGVSNIRSLFLGKNRISEIKNLEPLVYLQQIALGPNRLTEISKGLLPLRHTLKELYMQQNQIMKIQNIQQLSVLYNKVEHLQNLEKLTLLECLYLNGNKINQYQQLINLKANSKLTTISLFGNDVTKQPGYRMKLVELLPQIDDIDGTPMKTSYKIIFGSSKSINQTK